MYKDIRDRNSVFEGLIASDIAQVGVQWHNQPELVNAELVTGNYFDVLGVRPAAGRLFVQSDDMVPNGNPLAVLSYSYWQRRFGLDPKVVGESILINGHPFTVIGVSAPGFQSMQTGYMPAVYTPMTMKEQVTPGWNDLDNRRSIWLNDHWAAEARNDCGAGGSRARSIVAFAPRRRTEGHQKQESISSARTSGLRAISLFTAGRGASRFWTNTACRC